MTAIAEPGAGPRIVPLSRRVLNGARIHAASPWANLVLPWLILATVFGVTYAIWRMVVIGAGDAPLDENAFRYAGGVTWILFYMIAVASQAMNQTFRFATSLASTRRDYYLGSSAFFVALAVMYATGITVLAAIERATDGWGLDGSFFAPAFLYEANLAQVWFFYLAFMLLMLFIGAAVGAVFLRWRATGLVAFFIALCLLLVVTIYAITRTNSWVEVGELFSTSSITTLAAATLPVSALCAVVGFLLLRRASIRP